MLQRQIICQLGRADRDGSDECKIVQEAIMRDIPLHRVTIKSLPEHTAALANGQALPTGSVGFLREAMRLSAIPEPANISYPGVLREHLHRDVHLCQAASVSGRWFVKPATTKAFTGIVLDTLADPERLSAHDRVQYDAFRALPPEREVWVSAPVTWLSEVRYYVLDGKLVGEGRYDDGPDDAPLPDPSIVCGMIERLGAAPTAPAAFALDVGVLGSGETALVECNDAWATGFYTGTLTPASYLAWLSRRWQELLDARQRQNGSPHAESEVL